MVPVTVSPAVAARGARSLAVVTAFALLLGPVSGRAFAGTKGEPSRSLAIGQGAPSEPPRKGEVRYQALGPDGATRTITVASPSEGEAIVKLKGRPLAEEWNAARVNLRAFDAHSTDRRLRGRMPAYVAQAAERLRIQHRRVEEAITRFDAQVRKARGGSGSTRINHRYDRAFNGFAVQASAEVLERLRRHPDVEYVRPAVKVEKALAESTAIIGAPELWAQGLTGVGVVVGIIDTGVDYTHPDLGGGYGPGFKVLGGYDFVNGDDDPRDDNGHGTHVAGIVAANGAVKGVAPDARIVAYKVLDSYGSGWTTDVIAAIEKACDPDGDPMTDDALDVVNLSLGGPGNPDDPVSQAVDDAFDAGVLVVVAAGNEGDDRRVGSPGCARNALTVGASDDADQIAGFSSRGPTDVTHAIKPDLVAPGVDIRSTFPGGGYFTANGTSMATPHVAGAAALLLQHDPSAAAGALKSRLMLSARDVGAGLYAQGSGRLDLPAALALTTTVVPASLSFGLDDPDWREFRNGAVLSVTNDTATARDYTAALGDEMPQGLTVSVSPGSFTLAPGATTTVNVGIHVDNSIVGDVTEPPYGYLGKIQISSGAEQLRVPFSLVKSTYLRFSADAPVDAVYAYNDNGRLWALSSPSGEATLLLPRGQYHVLVKGAESPAPGALRLWQVLREGVTVQGELAVQRAEARHVMRGDPRDVRGRGMWGMWDYFLRTPSDWTFLSIAIAEDLEYQISDAATTYAFDWLLSPWSTPDNYIMAWHSTGVSGSRDLTNDPADIREARLRFDIDTGASDLWTYARIVSPGGQSYMSMGRSGFGPPYVRPYYLMAAEDPEALFQGVEFSVRTDWLEPALQLTPMVKPKGEQLELSLNGRSDLDQSPVNTPLFLVDPGVLSLAVEPQSWFGRFLNEDNRIRLRSSLGGKDWLFVGELMDTTARAEMPYTISQGAGTRSGSLPGASENDAPLELEVEPGPCRLRIDGPTGTVAGRQATTSVLAAFDTTAADPNPPYMSHFNVLSNGRPSRMILWGERGVIRFRAYDDSELRDVRLYYRLDVNNMGWWPLALQREGEVFTAVLPDPSASGLPRTVTPRPIPVSLRVVLRDAQGNSVTNDLTPAFGYGADRLP